jgi:hypothetical protein
MMMRGGGGFKMAGFRHGGGFRHHGGFRHGFHHRRHWGHRGYGWGYVRPVAYVGGSCWVTRPRVNYFGEVVLRKFWVCG